MITFRPVDPNPLDLKDTELILEPEQH